MKATLEGLKKEMAWCLVGALSLRFMVVSSIFFRCFVQKLTIFWLFFSKNPFQVREKEHLVAQLKEEVKKEESNFKHQENLQLCQVTFSNSACVSGATSAVAACVSVRRQKQFCLRPLALMPQMKHRTVNESACACSNEMSPFTGSVVFSPQTNGCRVPMGPS